MDTVIIHKDEIRLNSSLNEYSFGKTNYFTLLSEKGFVFNGDKFENWCFDNIDTFKNGVKSEKVDNSPDSEEIVFYCGKNPLSENAKSLLEYFNIGGELLFKAVCAVCKALTNAARNNVKISVIGAGGIIVDTETSNVLFLPENIFKYSTNLLSSEDYFNENTGWLNQTIKETPAICYERAVIVYKLLTHSFPYSAIDEAERNADILDKNFLPLELSIPDINKGFAQEINRALKLNSTSVSVSGNHKKGTDWEDLTVHPDFDFNLLEEAWNISKNTAFSQEELNKRTADYLKTQKSKIEAKRSLRRNTTGFIIAVCAAICIIIMTISSVKRQNNQFTSKGLTSTEVIQGFFQGINEKSLNQLSILVKGTAPEKYVSNVTEIFLLEKQVVGFTREGMYGNPANWLFNITNDERYNKIRVFGITNLVIDGQPEDINVSIYRKSEHPEAITEENNKTLSQNDNIKHKVEYYILQTNPEDFSILVEKVNEEYTLTYKNEKWLITDISSVQEIVPVDTDKFKKDYFTALAQNSQDEIKAVESLKDKYIWLPEKCDMEKEYVNIM